MINQDKGSLILLQESNYLVWAQQDQQLLHQPPFLLNLTPQSSIRSYYISTFEETGNYDFYCKIQDEWRTHFPFFTKSGVEISKIIMPIPQPLNLRSLAIQAHFKLRLSFHSSFYIFLRVLIIPTIYTPVIKISRDTTLKGIFLSFATIDPHSHKFTYIKQGQVPELESNKDYFRDIEVEVVDNGNDKVNVTIRGSKGKDAIQGIVMGCEGFLPQLEMCTVWIAGSGDSTKVSEIEVRYRQRMLKQGRCAKAECVCIIN